MGVEDIAVEEIFKLDEEREGVVGMVVVVKNKVKLEKKESLRMYD